MRGGEFERIAIAAGQQDVCGGTRRGCRAKTLGHELPLLRVHHRLSRNSRDDGRVAEGCDGSLATERWARHQDNGVDVGLKADAPDYAFQDDARGMLRC